MNSLFLVIVLMLVVTVSSFRPVQMNIVRSYSVGITRMSMSDMIQESLFKHMMADQSMMLLADTSISEEEVLSVAGQATDLPDPLFAVGIAAAIFLGVAILQFSLGDLTKEEGQARVRDFLQTKKSTERKRGYFD